MLKELELWSYLVIYEDTWAREAEPLLPHIVVASSKIAKDMVNEELRQLEEENGLPIPDFDNWQEVSKDHFQLTDDESDWKCFVWKLGFWGG